MNHQIHNRSNIKRSYFLARHINFLPWQLYSDDRAAGSHSACLPENSAARQAAPSQSTLLFMPSLRDKIWPNLDEWGGQRCWLVDSATFG